MNNMLTPLEWFLQALGAEHRKDLIDRYHELDREYQQILGIEDTIQSLSNIRGTSIQPFAGQMDRLIRVQGKLLSEKRDMLASMIDSFQSLTREKHTTMIMDKEEIKDAIKAILYKPNDVVAKEVLVQLINSATIADAIVEVAAELEVVIKVMHDIR